MDRTEVSRNFYDADLQYRHPLLEGCREGWVGPSYNVPNSRFAIGGEGTGRFYKWDRDGFNKNQLGALWSGGVSYRFDI